MAKPRLRRVLRLLLTKRSQVLSVIVPLVFLPLVFQSQAAKCGYVTIIMIVYWITEALPIPITGFFPAILFPILGIQDAKSVAINYMSDQILFLIGVLIIACAAERTNLHKRIALRGMRFVGSNPYRLMLCLMSLSSFLSMWLSNTAVASMMVSMGKAIAEHMCPRIQIEEAEDHTERGEVVRLNENGENETAMEMNAMNCKQTGTDDLKGNGDPTLRRSKDKKNTVLGSCILLSIAYGTTIGGSATLTGTLMPIILNAQLTNKFGPGSSVGFDSWLAFSFPLQLLCVICSYLWMCLLMWWLQKRERRNLDPRESYQTYAWYAGDHPSASSVQTYIKNEYAKLGRMKWGEYWTLSILGILVVIWLFADMKFMQGWISLFQSKQVSITCVTLGFAVLFFIIPLEKPRCAIPENPKRSSTILEWRFILDAFPWGLIFIIGGYLALADGINESGLGGLVQDSLGWLSDVDDWVVVLVITTFAAISTEMIGNISLVVILFPILVVLAEKTHTHPWFYLIPLTLACNLAFMLPIATPVNMIVYTCGNVTILEMVRAGFMLNIIGLLFTNLLINTYGYLIFDFNSIPYWALKDTVTSTPTNSSDFMVSL